MTNCPDEPGTDGGGGVVSQGMGILMLNQEQIQANYNKLTPYIISIVAIIFLECITELKRKKNMIF